MNETVLKERIQELVRAKQRTKEARDAFDAPQVDLEKLIRRMVEERPDQALQLRDLLRIPSSSSSPATLAALVKAVASLSTLMTEFGSPSTVPVNPARLSDVWASVGGYLRHGMREMDKRLEHDG